MEEKKKKMQLPKVLIDEFFTTQEERDLRDKEHIESINIADIDDFPNHPFKVLENDDMQEMVQSIIQYGVLVPALVRPKENGKYEMVAGHRRKKASELASLSQIPCIVRNLTDDEATIIMVDSNLQREQILPSEKAFAYKMKLDAITHQGKRNDLTSSQVATKLKGELSAEIVGKEFGDSKDKVYRFIKLTRLIKDILDMVDEGKIALGPAAAISYLTKEEQGMLYNTMKYNDCTPSQSQALELKELSKKHELTIEKIEQLLEQEKPNQKEKYSFHKDRIRNLLPKNIRDEQVEDYVVKAVEFYSKYQRKKEMAR